MPLEYEIRDGALVWIKNPVTGVISYVVDVRGKSFAFTLGGRSELDPAAPTLSAEEIAHAQAACPFCPGNEAMAPAEILRVTPAGFPQWKGDGTASGAGAAARWVMRVFNNLFPRVPAELTGGRNESYIVVEDPRHFSNPHPRAAGDLMYTGALGEEHFLRLVQTDVAVMRRAMENGAVRSIVIRKNQGRESGASQPHLHQQLIGAPSALPALVAEAEAERRSPALWDELLELVERLGLLIEQRDGVVSFASPIGAFPRSYDVMMPRFCGTLAELEPKQLQLFARAMCRILRVLGPLPLDYEIHQGEGLPLHAHINSRLYPYSAVAGTLNLPSVLVQNVAALRRALQRHEEF
jgi:UDPglucose--hexose-1-phosphate uridylyltransferase